MKNFPRAINLKNSILIKTNTNHLIKYSNLRNSYQINCFIRIPHGFQILWTNYLMMIVSIFLKKFIQMIVITRKILRKIIEIFYIKIYFKNLHNSISIKKSRISWAKWANILKICLIKINNKVWNKMEEDYNT